MREDGMKTLVSTEEPIRLVACFRATDTYRPTARHDIAWRRRGLLRRLRRALWLRREGLDWRTAWREAPLLVSSETKFNRLMILSPDDAAEVKSRLASLGQHGRAAAERGSSER